MPVDKARETVQSTGPRTLAADRSVYSLRPLAAGCLIIDYYSLWPQDTGCHLINPMYIYIYIYIYICIYVLLSM